MNILKHIHVWLNSNVWPFKQLSDLKQQIDEAEHAKMNAKHLLQLYIDRDVSDAELKFVDVLPEALYGTPQKIQVYTGIKLDDIQENKATSSIDVKTITLTPVCIHHSIDKRDIFRTLATVSTMYSTHEDLTETTDYFCTELASSIAEQMYKHVLTTLRREVNEKLK